MVTFSKKSFEEWYNPFSWGKIAIPVTPHQVQKIYKIFGKIHGWSNSLYEDIHDIHSFNQLTNEIKVLRNILNEILDPNNDFAECKDIEIALRDLRTSVGDYYVLLQKIPDINDEDKLRSLYKAQALRAIETLEELKILENNIVYFERGLILNIIHKCSAPFSQDFLHIFKCCLMFLLLQMNLLNGKERKLSCRKDICKQIKNSGPI